MQKRLEGGQVGHEEGGVVAPGQLLDLRGQLRLEVEAEAAAGVGLDGRTGMVGGQLEELGCVGQLREPVVELGLQLA